MLVRVLKGLVNFSNVVLGLGSLDKTSGAVTMYSRAEMVLCPVVCWDCNVLDNTAASSVWFESVVSLVANWSSIKEGGLDLR
jgi:hypothetical protein